MPRFFRYGAILALLTLTLTQFNNCGAYQEPSTGVSGFSSVSCDSDCITIDKNNMAIYVNGLNESGQMLLNSTVSAFNLGGECNEGGFPYNTIRWELYQQSLTLPVRTSESAGILASGTANTRCTNGRFLLYVNLANIAGDSINRVGLNVAPVGQVLTRLPHSLAVEIYGQDASNGLLQKGGLKARTIVNLIPQ